MNNLPQMKLPMWKLFIYGAIAALAVSGMGVYRSDYKLVLFGFFAGAAIFGFGFVVDRSVKSLWAVRHIRLLLLIYAMLQTILFVWMLLEKKH
jgi:hypothetical protein